MRFVQFECALRPVHTIAPDQTVSSVRNEQIWPVVSSAGVVLGGARGETSQPLARFRVEGFSPPKEITLELKVKVCTIKSESPSPVVHSCTDLEQYVQFLQLVEEAKAAGHKHPLKWTIQEAVRRNILRVYLERKGGEVLSILMTEYDYATDMAVLKEESYEDGLFVGLELVV